MVMVSPRYSWEWFHLEGSEIMFPYHLWLIFMVSGCGKPFQTHEDEGQIGKTYRVTLHTHPTPKYLMIGDAPHT